MATKNHYLVQWVADFQNDLVCLPVELQVRWPQYQKLLAIDPYHTLGWPSHHLSRMGWLDWIYRIAIAYFSHDLDNSFVLRC